MQKNPDKLYTSHLEVAEILTRNSGTAGLLFASVGILAAAGDSM